MAGQDPFDPMAVLVPQIMAGAMTVKCECGWEMVLIMPEEQVELIQRVFLHIKEAHHVTLPVVCCFWH